MSIRPWLLLPAKFAHDVAPLGLELAALVTREVLADVKPFSFTRKNRTVFFRNPLGIAGGVDKDATQISGWRHFGAGFVEIGTVTPKPQAPNPGRIIGRDIDRAALWNRMGFPGAGAHVARENLREWRYDEVSRDIAMRFPVFVNLGKQRETTLEMAHRDYAWLIDFFSEPSRTQPEPLADAFVINISSPNTKGLRELFARGRFYEFLAPIAARLEAHGALGFLKLSPDMDEDTLASAVEVALRLDLDGFIATNTTAARPAGVDFPAEGGLSGGPLTSRSREILRELVAILGAERQGRLVVSAGGVLSGKEAATRLALGADLVQTYSGLVFQGPFFFAQALRELSVRHSS